MHLVAVPHQDQAGPHGPPVPDVHQAVEADPPVAQKMPRGRPSTRVRRQDTIPLASSAPPMVMPRDASSGTPSKRNRTRSGPIVSSSPEKRGRGDDTSPALVQGYG